MRPRAQSYRNLDSNKPESHVYAVPWYWRLIATIAHLMILGAFLMLPATFSSDNQLRASKAALGISGVAILTAGFSITALLTFATTSSNFHSDSIFLPALTASLVGLLTIPYVFLTSARYVWNTQALLLTVAASTSTLIYTTLLIWTHRRKHSFHQQIPREPSASLPLTPCPSNPSPSLQPPYQNPEYYENYVRNMFPASTHSLLSQNPTSYDPHAIPSEEMQRQQMLMLLLQTKDAPPTPDPSGGGTFWIEWQGGEVDDTPVQGYYAPAAREGGGRGAGGGTPRPGVQRQWTSESLRPWDGVWRGVSARRGRSREDREGRRREIEMGGR